MTTANFIRQPMTSWVMIEKAKSHFGESHAYQVSPNVIAVGTRGVVGYLALRLNPDCSLSEGQWLGELEFGHDDIQFLVK